MVTRIAMVAGEASGDLLAAHLMRALRRHLPDVRFVGIGGPKMEAEGFEAWWPAETLAVNGYVDVLKRYRELSGIRCALRRRLQDDPPAAFIGVDAPDFNLWLEGKLKARGIPAIHFISPSIWAWRGNRIRGIRRNVDHMLCLFPFEKPIYDRAGVAATYVGHPLADQFPLAPSRAGARERLQLPLSANVVAVLPGSRQGEVSRLADCFIGAMQRLHALRPEVRFLVPFATRETRELFETALYRLDAQALPVTLMFGHSHDAMEAADVVLVASGTATLEAALLKRPMVIAYRVAPLNYRLMKRMAYLPYIGLPNILAGEFVVPEFVQDAATPDALAEALLRWLQDGDARRALEARFTALHEGLRQGTAARAAQAILPLLR